MLVAKAVAAAAAEIVVAAAAAAAAAVVVVAATVLTTVLKPVRTRKAGFAVVGASVGKAAQTMSAAAAAVQKPTVRAAVELHHVKQSTQPQPQ